MLLLSTFDSLVASLLIIGQRFPFNNNNNNNNFNNNNRLSSLQSLSFFSFFYKNGEQESANLAILASEVSLVFSIFLERKKKPMVKCRCAEKYGNVDMILTNLYPWIYV